MSAHEECPYGASYCPKIESLRKMIDKNSKDLEALNENVVKLTTTIKNAAFFIVIAVTLGAGVLGAVFI